MEQLNIKCSVCNNLAYKEFEVDDQYFCFKHALDLILLHRLLSKEQNRSASNKLKTDQLDPF